MLLLAVVLAVVSTVLGGAFASWLSQETGPLIVLVAAAGFLLSLFRRRS
jgi:ABC-type Mn2+/Zn2+ transport system permease subunit